MAFEIYLVIEEFDVVYEELHLVLLPIAVLEPIYMASIEAYYRGASDALLLCLRLNQSISHKTTDFLIHEVSSLGLPTIVPADLASHDRDSLYLEQLPGYDCYVQQYPCLGDRPAIHRIIETVKEHADAVEQLPTLTFRPPGELRNPELDRLVLEVESMRTPTTGVQIV